MKGKIHEAVPTPDPSEPVKIDGAPYQVGQRVRVVAAVDRGVHDVAAFIGRAGRVDHLDYACGCGQSYPGDPMVGVRFSGKVVEEFWPEELSEVARG